MCIRDRPIGAGATGKANLSMEDHDKTWLKSKFAEVEWQGDLAFKEYLNDIDQARKNGYALDRDNYYLGISTVSSAFDNAKTGRRYCLTAVLLSGAHDLNSMAAVGHDLRSEAQRLQNLF